jgi:hypothetical protein
MKYLVLAYGEGVERARPATGPGSKSSPGFLASRFILC